MKYDVVLLPTLEQVEVWRKGNADARASDSFGQVVTTFDAWIDDLWELWGDGRRIVDGLQREMFLHAVEARMGEDVANRGLVRLATRCMRAGAGIAELEDAIETVRRGCDVAGLSPYEQAFLKMLACYEDTLKEAGLVERGSAVLALAENANDVFPSSVRALMACAAPLSWVQERFFARCGNVEAVVQLAQGGHGVGRAPEGTDVRFACPAGALAQPGLVADIVGQAGAAYGEGTRIVVAAVDPLDMFERVRGRLGDSWQLAVQVSKPFAQTDFGRAYLGFCTGVLGNPWDLAALSDVIANPLAGLSRKAVADLDKRWRANRLIERDEALRDAREVSESFALIADLASGIEVPACVEGLSRRVQADASHSNAWKAEQMAALRAVDRAMAASQAAGAGVLACAQVLEHTGVRVSARVPSAGPQVGEVLFTTMSAAARLQPGSCALVIVTDLTSERYPVADKDDAEATFFSKLGLTATDTTLAQARRAFSAVLALPSRAIVLMRPLGDANADETYPAAVLEEFVDAYRADPSDADEVDNAYRLPPSLREGMLERGEELLFANAEAAGPSCVQRMRAVQLPPMEYVSESRRVLVPTRRRDAEGRMLRMTCPSPSQIELYLECPFKWFAERRMDIEELDEGFGPLERGSFAHAVLEEFYLRFQGEGHEKVDANNLAEARELMRAVADEAAARQFDEKPGSGRFVPATELERREVSMLCDQLVAYLDFEARLLPAFHPAYLEYEIDADHAVEYAGHLLVGKVDRIDVDDAGHAVIVDYKGSVNAEHEIAGKTWAHPGKVQTRMYARAVERALGLQVVGALYVSYGRRPAASGAFDARLLEPGHLPGMRHDRCSCGLLDQAPARDSEEYAFSALTFGCMLDETEDLAAEAIASMEAGGIGALPAHKDACRFCPVLACPKRGA